MASLQARLAQAERLAGSPRSQWRAHLARCFTGEQYEGHRGAIIEALCSDYPQYTFTRDADPAYGGRAAFYMVSWWTRDQGRGAAPYCRIIVLDGPADSVGAVMGVPLVRTYPAEWAV